jgi:hypothetical protein
MSTGDRSPAAGESVARPPIDVPSRSTAPPQLPGDLEPARVLAALEALRQQVRVDLDRAEPVVHLVQDLARDAGTRGGAVIATGLRGAHRGHRGRRLGRNPSSAGAVCDVLHDEDTLDAGAHDQRQRDELPRGRVAVSPRDVARSPEPATLVADEQGDARRTRRVAHLARQEPAQRSSDAVAASTSPRSCRGVAEGAWLGSSSAVVGFMRPVVAGERRCASP